MFGGFAVRTNGAFSKPDKIEALYDLLIKEGCSTIDTATVYGDS